MTRLLVSVRNADEARSALDARAALIDVKEPLRGALGAADPQRIDEVIAAVAGRAAVSAALGELFEGPLENVGENCVRPSLRFVKWGLAGAAQSVNWRGAWAERIARLPPGVDPVAVQYADWQRANAPAPRDLLAACREHGVRTWLVDTHDKSQGGLLDVWPLDQLWEFVEAARDLRMMVVLGGSLALEALPHVLPLRPDFIAVRGAACAGGRESPLDPTRVRALVSAIEDFTSRQPTRS